LIYHIVDLKRQNCWSWWW